MRDELFRQWVEDERKPGQRFDDWLIAEIMRLREKVNGLCAELAAAKAEPPRPAAIMANSDGDIQAYEDIHDYLATRQPRGSWGYAVRSWTWHSKPA